MTTITETRKAIQEQEARWQSKVDDRGQAHVYRKIPAADLKVGDHLLEHIVGYKRQVATPILGIRQVSEGVILTIPDRHGDNSPVDELYRRDDPVFVSKTPHLEQYDSKENFLEKLNTARDTPMEQKHQQAVNTASRGVDVAWINIDAAVQEMMKTADAAIADNLSKDVQTNAVELSNCIILGSDAVAESLQKDAFDFARWNHKVTESIQFTKGHSAQLQDFGDEVADPSIRLSAAYARGSLDTTTAVALEQRQRCVLLSMSGPLSEYALEDARALGLVHQPQPDERGAVVAKIPPEAVLAREDGTLVALPMLTPDLRRMGVGDPVHLVADENGVYIRAPEQQQVKDIENTVTQETARIKPMEQQAETPRKPEYPRMESHLKDQEGTWHSVSLYVDKENQPRGMISIENKAQGIAEKYPVEFAERVSQKTSERFLTAKVDRAADSKPLHVNLMPFTGRDEVRGMRATFAERDVSLPKSQQFTPVGDGSALMKPNAALLQQAEKDRTAAFLRDKLNVDPVVAQQRFYDLIKTGPSQVNADLLATLKQPAGKGSQGVQR